MISPKNGQMVCMQGSEVFETAKPHPSRVIDAMIRGVGEDRVVTMGPPEIVTTSRAEANTSERHSGLAF
jgi:hypothetical protein